MRESSAKTEKITAYLYAFGNDSVPVKKNGDTEQITAGAVLEKARGSEHQCTNGAKQSK